MIIMKKDIVKIEEKSRKEMIKTAKEIRKDFKPVFDELAKF